MDFDFAGEFRAGEVVDTEVADLCFPGDPHISTKKEPAPTGSVVIDAQTEPHQFVSLENDEFISIIRRWLARLNKSCTGK